jgi:NAD(P)-dependent dehydrogenase (short-subunit alcohol dehydrogenase family)
MAIDLDGAVALVTGGANGTGAAAARRLPDGRSPRDALTARLDERARCAGSFEREDRHDHGA